MLILNKIIWLMLLGIYIKGKHKKLLELFIHKSNLILGILLLVNIASGYGSHHSLYSYSLYYSLLSIRNINMLKPNSIMNYKMSEMLLVSDKKENSLI